MARVSAWQRTSSDAVSWHQDEAMNATIYILRESGPTGFVLKEEGEIKNLRVFLGDPHTCTCAVYKRERNPCKHICWILLKKFKLLRTHELSYQFGLVEREINSLLKGAFIKAPKIAHSPSKSHEDKTANDTSSIAQRVISHDDVCPVCQEELLKKHQPVTYCRNGCGNSIHIKCMKIWADHQRKTNDDEIKCPICRENFGSYQSLLQQYHNSTYDSTDAPKLSVHLSTSCNGCGMTPIEGKCYKCLSCKTHLLCNVCYHGNMHSQHAFVFRLKRTQRWRPAPARNNDKKIPPSIIHELGTREISENDYDLLLELDRPGEQNVDLCGLPDHIVNLLPVSKVRRASKLLCPGQQCCVCLHRYEVNQFVRKLPSCGHIFHKECIDNWLLGDHRRCPVDNELVLIKIPRKASSIAPKCSGDAVHDTNDLIVPGIGISRIKPLVKKPETKTPQRCRTSPTKSPGNLQRTSPYHNIQDANLTVGDLLKKFNNLSQTKKQSKPNLVKQRQAFSSSQRRRQNSTAHKPDEFVDFWILGNPILAAESQRSDSSSPPVFLSSDSESEYVYPT